MLKNWTLTTLLLFSLITFAQRDIKVEWGPEYQNSGRGYISDIVGEDETGFYVLKVDRDYYLEKYKHSDLSLMFSKELPLTDIGRDHVDFERLLFIDGKLLFFTSFWDKETDMRSIYAQTISPTGEIDPELTPIHQGKYERKKELEPFQFIVSRKRTKFMLYFDNAYNKKDNEQFKCIVFDGSLNKQLEETIELPNRDQVVGLSRVQLDEAGNIYVLTSISPDKKKGERYERKVQNETYSVLAYYANEGELQQYEINLGKTKWVSDVTYTVNTEGNLLIGGFYSNESAGTMNGTFFLAIDRETKDVISQNLKPFSREFMLNFMNERQFKRERDLGVFDLGDIVLKDDGGAVFVAEYYYHYWVTTTSQNGVTRTTHHYLYHDVIAISIDEAGNIDWISQFPKRQHTTNDNGFYSSYALSIHEDKMRFIFNDNPKNIVQYQKDPRKLKTMSGAKKAIAMMVTMDSDGNTRRTPLFEAKEYKTILRPKLYYNSKQTGTTLIFGVKRKNYKFGKLQFL